MADHRELRHLVLSDLESQGFALDGTRITATVRSKEQLRALNEQAVSNARLAARPALMLHEPWLLSNLAESRPSAQSIRPFLELVPVGRSSSALLWRWASLHWSIPVSAGYGRRMRFLVRDAGHDGALMGIIGITDPVFSLGARDAWIGWDSGARRDNLINFMEAFALGAAPPYDSLLGGKLIAMLSASVEVAESFRVRYAGSRTRIRGRSVSPTLMALTTQSAFGRSSMYNRLTGPDGRLQWIRIGETRGTGDFQFNGETYRALSDLANEVASATGGGVSTSWKSGGFRNRKEVVFVALSELGLDPRALRVHGIARDIYIAPLVENLGKSALGLEAPVPMGFSVEQLTRHWVRRWGARAEGRPSSMRLDWKLY